MSTQETLPEALEKNATYLKSETVSLPVADVIAKYREWHPAYTASDVTRRKEDEHSIREQAERMYPALARAEQIGSYAGLRTAGRGANYVIEPSRALAGLIHVAAIRSTGLSASLGIGEHVAGMLAEHAGIELGPERRLRGAQVKGRGHWWTRAARYHEAPA